MGRAGASSREGGQADQGAFEAQKKTGRGLFLIPVSHPYLRGSDFSEAPTTRSTCSLAAFLVLNP